MNKFETNIFASLIPWVTYNFDTFASMSMSICDKISDIFDILTNKKQEEL